jgi:hypothetical protein
MWQNITREIPEASIGVFSHAEPGPLVLRRRQRYARRICLRGTLRALNYILALYSVLMLSWDFFTYLQWNEAMSHERWPNAPTGSTALEPTQRRASASFVEIDRTDEEIDVSMMSRPEDFLQSDEELAETELSKGNERSQTALQYFTLDQDGYDTNILAVLYYTYFQMLYSTCWAFQLTEPGRPVIPNKPSCRPASTTLREHMSAHDNILYRHIAMTPQGSVSKLLTAQSDGVPMDGG